MAKQKPQSLDLDAETAEQSMADFEAGRSKTIPEILAERRADVPLPATPKILVATVEVPLVDVPAGHYRPRHVNCNLDQAEADAMKRLLAALDQRGDRLASGRRVQTAADAVRWLLGQVGTAKIAD